MRKKTKKIGNQSTGMIGVYLVAAELSRLGLLATVTSRNAENTDILVANTKNLNSVCIQVKTSAPKWAMRSWRMGKKSEGLKSDNLLYVFVDLAEDGSKPDFYVVPSKNVARWVKRNHKKWMRTKKRNGKPHKETDVRVFKIKGEAKIRSYKDRWDLLKL